MSEASLAENVWYLYKLEDQQSPNTENQENNIKVTRTGYWKSMDAHRIPTSAQTVGTKTTLEFYEGQAPSGKRTGWLMHEYQADQKPQGLAAVQDYSSLCRVFRQIDQWPNNDGQNKSLSGDADCDSLGRYLLSLPGQESNFSSQGPLNKSQIVAGDEPSVTNAGSLLNEPRSDHSAEEFNAMFDISNGDYLEINDLLSPDSSSSSSGNSSNRSNKFDELFDADALLRDLVNGRNSQSLQEERTDYRFSRSTLVRSNQVVIRPPQPGSIQSQNSNVVVSASVHGNSSDASSPTTSQASSSTKSHNSNVNRTPPEGSQGNRSPPGPGGSSFGRVAKLGKKYCCFVPF
uniref:NAC domain-containing protein n=1 Tax=Ananas comosus var. bracteatus TaxID=296719 RepID=A0A6V7Q444_ANACO|nr:unnamed protein product [Ananas comosus var. bracteatus]